VTNSPRERWRLTLGGTVQGVGFRPGVFRLAASMGLAGWVANGPAGAVVEIEGDPAVLERFRACLSSDVSPLARPVEQAFERLELLGKAGFAIRESVASDGIISARVLSDLATCQECRRELFDPRDRRFRYPFLNCAHCGPRFSIIERLPYDRANTVMRAFALCEACRAEYANPADRRFHAQPIACPACGPRLEALDAEGGSLALREEALALAEEALRGGKIVALKGLGGFQLLADARDDDAIRRLRARKGRGDKPFAVLFPSMKMIREVAQVSPAEEAILAASPISILLLAKKEDAPGLAPSVAPGVADWGAMLPYTPLQHLLMADLGFPVVATSGNRSDEPLCLDDAEALSRLGGIADLFLTHNRPIARRVDDAVWRVILDAPQVLRGGLGWAPATLPSGADLPEALAVGAQQKNAVALSRGQDVFLSQHIGDLETPESLQALRDAAEGLARLHGIQPAVVVRDLHPDYASSHFADALNLPTLAVQHHEAHVLACAAERGLRPPFLGVAWDGTGLGHDGTIWGGEFFRVSEQAIERVATLRPFRLLGGEAAVREPRRAALGLLWEWREGHRSDFEDLPPLQAFASEELKLLRRAWERGLNAPMTSSMGRFFDAAAALAGLRQVATFEGQAAMEWEALARRVPDETSAYSFALAEKEAFGLLVGDWAPLLVEMLADWRGGLARERIAARFHRALADLVVRVAERVGEKRVALSGGCFQSRLLRELADARLREAGFETFWPRAVPPNDGGIAFRADGGAGSGGERLRRVRPCAWRCRAKWSKFLRRANSRDGASSISRASAKRRTSPSRPRPAWAITSWCMWALPSRPLTSAKPSAFLRPCARWKSWKT
jgi:hydrogenase maturation protein HypF